MAPIIRPNPLDPATPPLVIWQGLLNGSDLRLVWSKRDDKFSHYLTYNPSHIYAVCAESLVNYLAPHNPHELLKISILGISQTMLHRHYGSRLSMRIVRLGAARATNAGSSANPWRMSRTGQQLNRPSRWSDIRNALAGMAPLLKVLASACRENDFREIHIAADSLVEMCDDLEPEHQAVLVHAANDIAEREGQCRVLLHASCGHGVRDGDETEDNRGSTYCQDCADVELVRIDGEYHRRCDVYYWESDGEYHEYEEDNDEDDEDTDGDDEPDCPSSQHLVSWGTSASSSFLDHDKSFTPSALGDFTMGVELEVECNARHEFSNAISHAHSALNVNRRYAMFKEDGSLGANGFEIVTAARRLDEHVASFASWKPHSSLAAWNPGTCGVHVHIDSRAFSGLTLGKFLMFINDIKNKAFLKALAGRHPSDGGSAQNYCASQGQEHLDSPAKALKGGHHSRYRMVNLCNLSGREAVRLGAEVERDCKGDYSTVELRIFRASLKKERLLAQIEFSHAAVMFCRTASWHALNGDAFKNWLKSVGGHYKHLARWYGINVPRANTLNVAPAAAQLDETC